ncbi:2-C-methyl-D-erythritol 4-phosphate cytidylyltransferase [Alkaliphilus serpentinus]|uniref:2-C-methyl-D-erythritol 4-phosphate cytidylyltransferase n=1 Tax=Alkaliphilus serpentinus TaxID=1482731 RepID=A0A833MB59_9FIRM|nr:2-C-methyl-D-erythritol 4-phosphate cytidylyltransferase [Alkaliphilus serpentinus]KAB3532414.1 2-C-methyl-D-erythritol 4-phosphate cytidylyltransferase [Alkaliphilus serpentinus]
MSRKTYGIIVAAGKGKRMDTNINKQYIELKGKPILAHTLEVFEKCEVIDGVIVVVGESEEELCRVEIVDKYTYSKVVEIVVGGQERFDSVSNGIKALPKDCDIVVIHDGARPFVSTDIIKKSIETAEVYGSAIAAVPVKDTIKLVNNMQVEKTLDRKSLWAVQTPQTFKVKLLEEGFNTEFSKEVTDDSTIIEGLGYHPRIIEGSYSNIKITTPEDLLIAEMLIMKRGEGND